MERNSQVVNGLKSEAKAVVHVVEVEDASVFVEELDLHLLDVDGFQMVWQT